MRALALALLALAAAPAATAAGLDQGDFRYVRELTASGADAIRFQADGPLFAHARVGFGDLRIVDASDGQVPWRFPPQRADETVDARVLDAGRAAGAAVALLDLGASRVVRDRIELELDGRDFLGRATVFGSDTRAGTFVRLGTTPVYDVAGAAARSRSTTAVFPPSDFRYYRVVVTHVRSIAGATATASPSEARPQPLRALVSRREDGESTRLVLDLGHRQTPVDEVRVSARTKRYDRAVGLEVSDTRGAWRGVSSARIVHVPGTLVASLPLNARGRFVRLTVENGDDAPLTALRAVPLARPRILLAAGGHPRPYRLLYGNRGLPAPRYDFALLSAAAVPASRPGTLGAERLNPAFDAPRDARSFLARNGWVVQAALVLVAVALGLAGLVVLRRRA